MADDDTQDIRCLTKTLSFLQTKNIDVVTAGETQINGDYYAKLFSNIIITIKEQYSMKTAANSVGDLSELSQAIYALHAVGDYAQNKTEKLKQKLQDVAIKCDKLKLKLKLPKITAALDEILQVATLVNNTKANSHH